MENYTRVFVRRKQLNYLRKLQALLYLHSRQQSLYFSDRNLSRGISRLADQVNGEINRLVIEDRMESYREVHINIDMLLPIYVDQQSIRHRDQTFHLYDKEIELLNLCDVNIYCYRLDSQHTLLLHANPSGVGDVVILCHASGYREWTLEDFQAMNLYGNHHHLQSRS